jgi:hypothetical protein
MREKYIPQTMTLDEKLATLNRAIELENPVILMVTTAL